MKELKRQLVFIGMDIKGDFRRFLIVTVQLAVAAVMLLYIFIVIEQGSISLKMMDRLKDQKNLYGISYESSKDMQTISNDPKAGKQFQMFFSELCSMKDTQMITMRKGGNFYFSGSQIEKMGPDVVEQQVDRDTYCVAHIWVTDDFFSFFHLKPDGFFSHKEKEVILGSKFLGAYKKGDIFQSGSGDQTTYKVVGFLPQGSTAINPFQGKSFTDLDGAVLESISGWESYHAEDVISLVKNTMLVTKKNAPVEIENLGRKAGVPYFSARSAAEQIAYCANDTYDQIATIFIVVALIFVFVTMGIVANMTMYLNKSKKNFSVHRIYGGNKIDIEIRVLGKLWVPLLISMLAVLLMGGWNSPSVHTLEALALYGLLLGVKPFLDMGRFEIIETFHEI